MDGIATAVHTRGTNFTWHSRDDRAGDQGVL